VSAGQDRTRVGTGEREKAIALLSEHFSAGRLTIEEFSQRCAAAGAAVTRDDLSSIVADLPNASSIVFGARLEQVVAERIHKDEQLARSQATKAELQKRAAAAPAAELEMCLEELADLLSNRVKPASTKIGRGGQARSSPEGFLVYSEEHWVERDSNGSPVQISAEVLLPDGRLWKSWYRHAFTRIEAEFSEYGAVKVGPFLVEFDHAGRLYARSRKPPVFGEAQKIELAQAFGDIATRVIKQGEPVEPEAKRAVVPGPDWENMGFAAALRRLLLGPGGRPN
jgi:hypothetical protein